VLSTSTISGLGRGICLALFFFGCVVGCRGASKQAPADAAPVAIAIDAAKPAPIPIDAGSGMPDCDALVVLYGEAMKCAPIHDAMAEALEMMKESWSKLDPSQKQAANTACKAGIDNVRTTVQNAGC
jgi:hypothetical protein